MTDTQTMQEMITGLQQKKKNLQADEAVFLKLSGINEQIEKAAQDSEEYKSELAEAKKKRDDAKAKKAAAVSAITAKIAGKMNAVLPFGEVVFMYEEIESGSRSMIIGWKAKKVENTVTPYNGLSGGEKQMFDAALANVLDADIIVVEAAELDDSNLIATLKELSKLDKQVLVNTCHSNVLEIEGIPKNFKIVEM